MNLRFSPFLYCLICIFAGVVGFVGSWLFLVCCISDVVTVGFSCFCMGFFTFGLADVFIKLHRLRRKV